MFITVERNVECSKCGSKDYESFSDDQYQGIRCKNCGHEKKEPHPHLTHTHGDAVWVKARDEVTKF